MKKSLSLIGYASGVASNDDGCQDGPVVLQQSDILQQLSRYSLQAHWLNVLQPDPKLTADKYSCVADICHRLAENTRRMVENNNLFTVIGGDHSSAIGTWSGVAAACQTQGKIGLIWIDAHLDSHTPDSSESGNIHGMPLACLLGLGDRRLTSIAMPSAKLLPQNVTLIGVRSFEQGELALLQKLEVRIIFQEELAQRGMSAALAEAHKRAMTATVGYGFSIDLDAIDPQDAPGVGKPEPNGIAAASLCEALKIYRNDPALLGVEIAEFNPGRDKNNLTFELIMKIIRSLV